MNELFVLEITVVDGVTAKAVWEHESLESAKAQFHQILASAYSNPNMTYALAQIIDSQGYCRISEVKNAPIEVEPGED